MPYLFSMSDMPFRNKKSPLPEFAWKTSPRLAKLAKSEHLEFDIRSLSPGKFSFPYHFHRNAEEVFVIISGKAMMRSPKGFKEIREKDVVFFEKGPSGAHQLYNHGEVPCVYFDLRTTIGMDVCEYPDSGKINILPDFEVYESSGKVDYFKGEENVREKWPEDVMT